MKHPIRLLAALTLIHVALAGASLGADEALASHRQFLDQHCGKCHSGKKPKGGFDVSTLSPDLADADSHRQWLTVLDQPSPLCNLYVNMLQHLGIETDEFSSADGTLSGLELKAG